MTALDVLGDFGAAVGINDSESIAGATGSVHPVLLRHGVLTDLGDLGGGSGLAVAISASAQIVGSCDVSPEPDHRLTAVVWPSLPRCVRRRGGDRGRL